VRSWRTATVRDVPAAAVLGVVAATRFVVVGCDGAGARDEAAGELALHAATVSRALVRRQAVARVVSSYFQSLRRLGFGGRDRTAIRRR
jgi:hypothetical protein